MSDAERETTKVDWWARLTGVANLVIAVCSVCIAHSSMKVATAALDAERRAKELASMPILELVVGFDAVILNNVGQGAARITSFDLSDDFQHYRPSETLAMAGTARETAMVVFNGFVRRYADVQRYARAPAPEFSGNFPGEGVVIPAGKSIDVFRITNLDVIAKWIKENGHLQEWRFGALQRGMSIDYSYCSIEDPPKCYSSPKIVPPPDAAHPAE